MLVSSQNPRTNMSKNLGGACVQEFIILNILMGSLGVGYD